MKKIIIYIVAILLGVSSKSPATFNPSTIYSHNSAGEQVIAHDSGNSYSLDKEGHVIISYNNNETIVEAPLTLNLSTISYESGMSIDETGFFISKEKTAIIYSSSNWDPVQVIISEDMGKSWNTYSVTEELRGSTKYIGFMTKNDGWIVLSSFHGMGSEDHYIYKTYDGGKTWMEVVGDVNNVYARVLTGAGFVNDDIGFLCFRYETDFQPAILWTQDGGLTWEKLHIKLPEEFDIYSKTPISPIFNEANGLFPILLSENGASDVVSTIYLRSKDYGKTWLYDEMYDGF